LSDDATPRLALPYLAAGQAQKHLTVNEALAALDGLVHTAVESRTLAAPPQAPADGAMYLRPPGALAAPWQHFAPGALLRFEAGDWNALAAPDGALVLVKDESRLLVRAGGAWSELGAVLGALQNLERLGLGAVADATNPFSARLNKALFAARTAAEGGDGDLRLTLNKETAGDVLSLLFQTGFSGRAELGLAGDDRLTLKTSGDGAAWNTALVADAAGRVRLPAQPAFGTYASAARTTTGLCAGYTALPHALNRGGAFDPATGLFTAPVAGAYALHMAAKSDGGWAGRALFGFEVNGTTIGEFAESYGPYQDVGASAVLELAAGDAVGVRLGFLETVQPVRAHFAGHLVG
jgi:hypothetical protein